MTRTEPASVAVDDDALVGRLLGPPPTVASIVLKERKEAASTIQSLQASIRVKDEALRTSAVALNAFIECLGHPTKDREHYRWRRLVTFAEGQAAMEANNAAAVVLGSDQPIGGE